MCNNGYVLPNQKYLPTYKRAKSYYKKPFWLHDLLLEADYDASIDS